MKKYVGKIKELLPSFGDTKLKGILVIIDGLGDKPCRVLEDMTPLEAAETPNLDFLATRGEIGMMDPVKPTFIPESDEALVSIFGNKTSSNTRGQFEARGCGINLVRGDLAFRINFATVDPVSGLIVDRRVARTLRTDEAEILAEALTTKIKLDCKFDFKPTMQHKGVLVLRGGFSDSITGNDLTYTSGKMNPDNKIMYCKSLDGTEVSQYSADTVNRFISQAHEILKNHPINKDRKKRGLLPANYILVRGPGVEAPNLKPYKRWFSTAYTPMEIGFSKVAGMRTSFFDYPRLEDLDSYSNLYEALKKSCKFVINTIKANHKRYSYAYVHIKETDFPGHDNKPVEKKIMLEYLDKTLFSFLRRFAPPNDVKVVVTGDHSTPCHLKAHSADSVPVLFYNGSQLKEKKFSEKEAKFGTFGRVLGNELLKKVGFVK